ncbi:MAG: NAD(+)/NADH kinase [Acutalibacteraceae bacterium]|nr:NAD(+)/NADH kinase [Acutalibacteraceae bacterium]
MIVAVITNTSKTDAVCFLPKVIDKLLSLGITPSLCEKERALYNSDKIIYHQGHRQLVENSDIIITIGGDGTIIHMARHAAEFEKPLLGINFGRVGFVATLEPTELDKLSNLLTQQYTSQQRMLLKVTVEYEKSTTVLYAINDAVISRGSMSRMLDLSVSVNGKQTCNYRADGLIFSTPTGSTAYSLSAGGPVICPDIECILLTPICPHSLFSRSVIFKSEDVLRVQACTGNNTENEAFLTVDGQHYLPLQENTKVTIEKYRKSFTLLSMEKKNFYTVLHEKLNERGV